MSHASRTPQLRVWIDATEPHAMLPLFGMPLLERQLRGLLEAGVAASEVRIELPEAGEDPPPLPRDVTQHLPLRWCRAAGGIAERLARAVQDGAGVPLLALEADAVVDPRLLHHVAGRTGALAVRGDDGTAVLRLAAVPTRLPAPDARLRAIADAGVKAGALADVSAADVPAYLDGLRRVVPAYLFRIGDVRARDRAERFLFWSNYKGSTDFLTSHVYPPLVWPAVRLLARWRVHPNVVTILNVVLTFAAVPIFAAGHWVSGLLLAYAMSVLDSVDGKLARLTFRASRLGHVLDHGLDTVHPPLWYGAWAWALAPAHPAAPLFQAWLWMTVCYVADRLVTRLFTARTGRSIHAYAPLDVRLRTIISRRNVNLVIFTAGLIGGVPVAAFYVIVAWQVATLGFHAARLIQFWDAGTAAT
jgi:phosphatidylglycerophosphate synthase